MDASGNRSRGFTLLEILVVLVIVGLLAGMVLPQLQKMASSIELSNQRADIKLAIEGLGYRAYSTGKPLSLTSSITTSAVSEKLVSKPVYPLQLPPGWQILAEQPITYSINGVCGGGTISIVDPDNRREEFRLNPPKCLVESADHAE